jgi:type IV pilus assembly protein PilO
VGAGLFLLYFIFSILPLKRELESKSKKVAELRETVARLKVIEKERLDFKKKISELKKKIAQIEEELPTGREEVSQIVASIAATTPSIEIVSVKREKKREKRYYVEYPYTIYLRGDYPSLLLWCEKLAGANRIINFGDVSIKALDKEEQKEGRTIEATVEIKAFTLKRTEE